MFKNFFGGLGAVLGIYAGLLAVNKINRELNRREIEREYETRKAAEAAKEDNK